MFHSLTPESRSWPVPFLVVFSLSSFRTLSSPCPRDSILNFSTHRRRSLKRIDPNVHPFGSDRSQSLHWLQMGGSINAGTPKWRVYGGTYHKNGWFRGYPHLWKPTNQPTAHSTWNRGLSDCRCSASNGRTRRTFAEMIPKDSKIPPWHPVRESTSKTSRRVEPQWDLFRGADRESIKRPHSMLPSLNHKESGLVAMTINRKHEHV